MRPRTFPDAYQRLGALHAHAMMLRQALGDLSPEELADVLAMAGLTVAGRTGAAAAARDAELRACAERLEASWAPRRAWPQGRTLSLRVETSVIRPCPAKDGDQFLIRPATDRPVLLLREAPPDFEALLGHLGTGAISAVDGDDQAAMANLTQLARGSRAQTQ